MIQKRKLTPYQRQIRFFTVFFGALMIGAAVGLLWLLDYRLRTVH
jgi:hypothetical protein